MSFDESIEKILQEAYFSSPYEKATGIKRQVNIQENDEFDEISDKSEFGMTRERILQAQHLAVLRALDDWHEDGEPMGKQGADILIDRYLHHLMHEEGGGLQTGDEVKDHTNALLALGHASGVKGDLLAGSKKLLNSPKAPNRKPRAPGEAPVEIDKKPPMSAERMRNLGKDSVKDLRKKMGGMKPKDEADIATGDDKIEAQKRLAAWKAGR
jgi:hypothetical protein